MSGGSDSQRRVPYVVGAGHLAYIEALVVRGFMLGEPNPLAQWEDVFDGADVSADIGQYLAFDDVLATCREIRESTLALLDSLTEEALDQASANVPAGLEETSHPSALSAICRRSLVHASWTPGRCATGRRAGANVGVACGIHRVARCCLMQQ